MTVYHLPALLEESIAGLNLKPEGIYVDVTFGGGGHSRAILEKLTTGRLIAFDQDSDAVANFINDERFTFLCQNFRYLKNNLRYHGVKAIDGLIADLGVSFHQFDEQERGFSFRGNAKLDMRMNRQSSVKASDILWSYEEERLADIFYNYGELTTSRRLAAAIVKARAVKPVTTVTDLTVTLRDLVPPREENKFWARLFQSLRIEVNSELVALKEMLTQALQLLKPGGRLAVITYHSLEDRLVKNFFRSGNFEGESEKDFYGNVSAPLRVVNRKVIVPTEQEIMNNSRARSARLRIAEKV
ncbi:MAG TPA: 16S rRNA (cytosine(1402)-N(4))-methyltransferase RsmH [Bacteroidales bacterium]|jgi:16S rRNA (cytosine1402-N4)-methyltransferase|nr:16S rRNA (cytosine(1402)-N(4))-methyltransferase RsmH [Bacteroidales bacterium]MZQ80009.1 16S rRNA (cytosine(1402)-N(4))-methyltransferase RsmH [Bacteroidales bacterium]HHU99072.1 16S rRNA (cytosine(1402)-N(4))-methyltransferase RsmH [Bacteroidales bacterium]HNY58290.1 16S rRNA (cytosine(1402)-N(4))-methyltransferase RsmH [Bacteroidales bacterium]HOE25154.1 16S rRNA (cytosine(1402)-N(4))-methyltransferase RsmH [Bacteroidales bacterium]